MTEVAQISETVSPVELTTCPTGVDGVSNRVTNPAMSSPMMHL